MLVHRRRLLAAGCLLALGAAAPRLSAAPTPAAKPYGLGFSLYGMKSLPLDEALRRCREIGYDCVELPVMADWPADSKTWTDSGRDAFRATLDRHRLRLSALMENLPLLGPADKLPEWEERLRRACEAARRLSPDSPPPIETILGGSPAAWEESKSRLLDRLDAWRKIAAEHQVVVAIKPHVAGAMHRPEHLEWTLSRIDSPWIRGVFDFSHYQLRGVELDDAVRRLAPLCAFAHVKDAQGDATKFQFLLPGDGTVDYPRLLRGLRAAGYQGDVVVEVSGQLHSRPDYDPLDAARRSYTALAPAWKTAEVPRG